MKNNSVVLPLTKEAKALLIKQCIMCYAACVIMEVGFVLLICYLALRIWKNWKSFLKDNKDKEGYKDWNWKTKIIKFVIYSFVVVDPFDFSWN